MYIRSESLTVTSFHYLFLHYKLYTEKKETEKKEKCISWDSNRKLLHANQE